MANPIGPSLLAYNTVGQMGGLRKVAGIISLSSLSPINPTASFPFFTLDTNGNVSAIGLTAGASFSRVELLRDNTGVTDTFKKDFKTGNNYATTTFEVILPGLTLANQTFVQSLKPVGQELVFLFQDRTGQWNIRGLDGLLEMTEYTIGTGNAETAEYGYKITIGGPSVYGVQTVDIGIIPTIFPGYLPAS